LPDLLGQDSGDADASLAPAPEITPDRPSAYLPRDRLAALAAGRMLPERVHGAALFADISGFTSLTEALARELGSQRASEVLTGHLNRVFHAVIEELHRSDGYVIYFSGDALTCWLDGDDGYRAAVTGLGMQEAIRREGQVTTPGGISVQLALKVAIAVGPARRFVVGDPGIQLIDVLAGSLIDRIAAVEQLADKGEVLAHESALGALGDEFVLGETRSSEEAGRVTVIQGAAHAAPHPRQPRAAAEAELPDELARQWLLEPVYERLTAGRGEFLAELRPAYPVFISFTGIDYEADESAVQKLDEFVCAAQHALASFGGSLLQVTLGDKGAYLYAVFGTPLAHEDDAARACAAALELQALERSTAAREIRIGITYGRLHSGTHGHARRRTFCCLGDATNLAARLMSKAPQGGIYISDLVQRRIGEGFTWTELEPLKLKGKAVPVTAYSLTGVSGRRSRRVERYPLPLVGRTQELGVLEARLREAGRGRGRIVGISAEAGMGKSRLVAEFIRATRSEGVQVAVGECQSYGTNAGYVVWNEIWRTLFGLDESLPPAEQILELERALGEIDPALVPRAPLLDAVLGLPIPENELTETFDPQLRKTSLENLLADCLRASARREPLVLVLEDCHWIDPLSRDLLEVVARTVATSFVLLVVVYRPEAALPPDGALGKLRDLEELQLSLLDEAQMSAVVETKLTQLLGESGTASGPLRDLVVGRAQGNPFYAEELMNYVHDQGVDLSDQRALLTLELPESLHSLVLSRIDTLPEAPRHTLKVASVIGRAFKAPMLPGVYPDLGGIVVVRLNLQALRRVDIVIPDREEDESFLMKHAVTQEVAYESLPYALRESLHGQIGAYLERQNDASERRLDLLAHHYWYSSDEPKKRRYLRLAAEQARASYANAAAIEYYERLASLIADGDRVDVLLELGKVLELVGEWERAREAETGALQLAEAIGDERARAWCEAAIAEVARKQNRYDEAAERLARAAAGFEALGDEPGLGRVLHLEGTLAAQRGKLDDARSRYEQSLAVRERLGDVKMMASVLSNLGIVAEYEGDFPLSRVFHEQALALRTELGDLWAIANSMTNLGMIATLEGRNHEARTRFEEAMRLNSEVGDNWRVVVCHNNLGNACRGLGDYVTARDQYAESLRAHLEHDDKWALAFLLEDVARLAALTGEPERALELLGAAEAIREQIGSPRSAGLDKAILEDVEPGIATLSADQQRAARARGAKFDPARAIDAAMVIG
jgi:predicted ATPase/class 3 adenylate cyclase